MTRFLCVAAFSAVAVGTLSRLAATQVAPAPDAGAVLFDTMHGPTLWARGATYKACFDAGGARFVPFLGSDAPRNFPIAFALREVRVGGEALGFEAGTAPRLEGSTISYDRGSLVEIYRAEPESLEQVFRFDALPRAGELSLRIGIDTELAPFADVDGIRFSSEYGGARYGKAVAFDARGRAVEAPLALVDGAIEIRVAAEFLATATAPITLDPLVATLAIDTSPMIHDRFPDVAYDASLDVYAVCWERFFSQTDQDVHGRILDGAGVQVAEFLIDVTPATIRDAKIAGIDALDRFLVVTIRNVTGNLGPAEGRIVDLAGGSPAVGPPVTLLSYACANTDLGGDPGTSPPYRFGLVADDLWFGLSFVDFLIVDENGRPGPFSDYDCGDGETFSSPRIAPAARLTYSGQRGWPILFRGWDQPCQGLRGLHMNADGTWQDESWISFDYHDEPEAVGSYLEGASGVLTHLVIWKRVVDGGPDLLRARAVHGTQYGSPVTIGPDPTIEYIETSADSDGSNFVVTYTARRTPGVSEAIFAETYALEALELVLTERVQLSLTGGLDGASALVSTRSGGGAPQRFLAAWHDLEGPDGDIEGALYDTPGPGVRYCTAAPNSVGPGAMIHAAGSISIELDQFELSANGCPPDRPGIFYLGLNQIELPFGEGFRCIGGATRRITPTLTTDGAGAVSLLLDFDQPYGELVFPGSPGVNYQFWYRDPAGGPAHFNLTDALHVEHTP